MGASFGDTSTTPRSKIKAVRMAMKKMGVMGLPDRKPPDHEIQGHESCGI